MMKHKAYTFINIFGLAIGMAVSTVLMLWISGELNYDTHHENSDRLYSLVSKTGIDGLISYSYSAPGITQETLRQNFAEIEQTSTYTTVISKSVSYEQTEFFNEAIRIVEPSFFEMFSFPLSSGIISKALSNQNSIILSERAAEKYFPDENPVGKFLTINGERNFNVTGVFRNMDRNTVFRFDYVVPLSAYPLFIKDRYPEENRQEVAEFNICVLLREGVIAEETERKISDYVSQYDTETEKHEVYLRKISNSHLYYLNGGYSDDMTNLMLGGLLGVLILIVACINYMNLATARAAERSKEIGIRKVAGVDRKTLVRQFFTESTIMSIIAMTLSLVFSVLILREFNSQADSTLVFDLGNWRVAAGCAAITLFTGFIAGIYPALYISAFQPINILKGRSAGNVNLRGRSMRKILVISQFTFSLILIIFTSLMTDQINFLIEKDIKQADRSIIHFRIDDKLKAHYDTFKSEILQHSGVEAVAVSDGVPKVGLSSATRDVLWPGKDPNLNISIGIRYISTDYFETLGLNLLSDISGDKNAALGNWVVLNEAASDLLGRHVTPGTGITVDGKSLNVRGIVEDYHYTTAAVSIRPLLIINDPERCMTVNIKINDENVDNVIGFIRDVRKKFQPVTPFEYSFLSETLGRRYDEPRRAALMLNYMTLFAFIISCLGLLGLASYTTQQRTKEIGIRKILGTSVSGIIILLNREFLKWVLIANLIAWTLDFSLFKLMERNLANFIDISPLYFLSATAFSVLVTLISVSWPAVRAATANPVDAIRYE